LLATQYRRLGNHLATLRRGKPLRHIITWRTDSHGVASATAAAALVAGVLGDARCRYEPFLGDYRITRRASTA